jgi:DNA-binding NarL/FixJ family response regulator
MQVEEIRIQALAPTVAAAATPAASTTPRPSPMSIRVLIVDDEALVRAGLRLLLQSYPDMQVVGEAADGDLAVRAVRDLRPDIVLMDVTMPRVDGPTATARLTTGGADHPAIIILTTSASDTDVVRAIRAGARGFLLKDAEPDRLIEAIRVVAQGDAVLAPSITASLLRRYGQRLSLPSAEQPDGLHGLTSRELEIVRLLARGFSNREIADALALTEPTVKSHISHVLLKLDLRDRTQAVIAAYEAGLIRPGAIAPG